MPNSVLMLVTSFHPNPMGGSEMQALRLAKELSSRGMDVNILSLGRRGQKSKDEVDGVRVYRVKTIFDPEYFGDRTVSASAAQTIEYSPNVQNNFIAAGKKTIFSFIFYFAFFCHAWLIIRTRNIKSSIIYVPTVEWAAFIGTLLGKMMGKKVVIKDSTANGLKALLRYPWGQYMSRSITRYSYLVAMTRAIRTNLIAAGADEKRIFSIPNGVA